MPEEFGKNEKPQSEEEVIAHKLEALLQEKTGETFKLSEYDGTYEIDTDTFFLTFTIEDDLFEIRSIEARGEAGLGGVIVRAVQKITAETNCSLIASNVLDTAIGFWQRMGFEPTNIDGEYYWKGE
jgi:hypothetical protein